MKNLFPNQKILFENHKIFFANLKVLFANQKVIFANLKIILKEYEYSLQEDHRFEKILNRIQIYLRSVRRLPEYLREIEDIPIRHLKRFSSRSRLGRCASRMWLTSGMEHDGFQELMPLRNLRKFDLRNLKRFVSEIWGGFFQRLEKIIFSSQEFIYFFIFIQVFSRDIFSLNGTNDSSGNF